MRLEPVKESARAVILTRIYSEPGVDERPDQPGPDRPLVISRVARAQVAVVRRPVIGMAWRERAQADRRQQPIGDHVEHGFPFVFVEDRILQRERQQLVRAAGLVVAALAVYDVEKVSAIGVPESAVERLADFFRALD